MARLVRHKQTQVSRHAAIARDEHKDSAAIVVAGYILILIAILLIVGAAYGLWLLLTRIFF